MTTDELRDLLLQGRNHCVVYLGAVHEHAKLVTEALLDFGFQHWGSNFSRQICVGNDNGFHWNYAFISENSIEYTNYHDVETVLIPAELLHPTPPIPDPTPEEIEAFYLEAIGVMS